MATTPTAPDVASTAAERRSHRVRRVALGLLALLVCVGLTGRLGVRSDVTMADAASGLRAELTFAEVARPALAVPFRLVVTSPGGFPGPVEVRITRAWLDSFDENGVTPDPDEATTDGAEVVWSYAPPPGSTFTVSLDTRVEPGVQWRRAGTTRVTVAGEQLRLDHTMWVLP